MSGVHGGVLGGLQLRAVQMTSNHLVGAQPESLRACPLFFLHTHAAVRLDLRSMATFEEQLVEHRVYLMRFARLQLRNDAWAEDAVSETMLAALAKAQSFGNRRQLKTWLLGLLQHQVT